MAVTIYKSTDASAPSLTGQVSGLITVLDAVLVNGYGSKTAAGWAKAFTGTNIAAYRAAAGNRYYLGVDDTNAQNARVRGFETMSAAGVALASGTGPFPTDVQVSGGRYVYKSSSADTQVRPWVIFASDRFFLMFFDNGTASATPNAGGYQGVFAFGDFFSFVATDTYNTMIAAADSASSGSPTSLSDSVTTVAASSAVPVYSPRIAAGTGASVALSRMSFGNMLSGTAGSGGASTPSPYPANGVGGLYCPPILLIEAPNTSSCVVRGMIPGLFHMPHVASSFTLADTFSGAAATQLAGRTFEIVRERFNNGGWFIETTAGGWTALTF